MEWLSKIADIVKLPTKYFVIVALCAGAILSLPTSILKWLHLDALPAPSGAIVGIVFIASCAVILVKVADRIALNWQAGTRAAERTTRVMEKLVRLDGEERAILREFVFNQSTLRLPMDKPAVAGLISSGVIQRVGAVAHGTVYGVLTAFRLSDDADAFLTDETLGIPSYLITTDGDGRKTLTEAGRDWIAEHRPSFAGDLDRFERPVHRHW
jgi:ammonia channel protein AmtB